MSIFQPITSYITRFLALTSPLVATTRAMATEMEITNKHYITKNPIKGPFEDGLQVAIFGNGCFWGSERGFWRTPGVYSTAVGYCGGLTEHPTYNHVCSGSTNHNECVQVVFDPTKISYVDILRQFWESHDPTQGMGQGNDRGTNYRSGVYCTTEDQYKLAQASKEVYQSALKDNKKGRGDRITTEIVYPAPTFYFAEDYHQQYLAKPGARPYCSAEPTGTPLSNYDDWKPEGLEGNHDPKLSEKYWKKHGPKEGCSLLGPCEQIAWEE